MNEQKRLDLKVSRQLAESYFDYLETFHDGAQISRRIVFEEALNFVIANNIDYKSVMRFRAKRREANDMPEKIHLQISKDIYDKAYARIYRHIPRMCNSIPYILTVALNARLYYLQLELISDEGLTSGRTRNDNYIYAVNMGIRIDTMILSENALRGIYGVFVGSDCVYVGKSENIFESLFVDDCFVDRIRHNYVNPRLMNSINHGGKISFSVLEIIKYDSSKHPLVAHLEVVERECYWKKYYVETNESIQLLMNVDN